MVMRWRDRLRPTRVEHLLAAATWVGSGVAGVVALRFAYGFKPHVLWQTGLGYALIWALLAYYAQARRLRRRLLGLHLWLVAVCFAGVLCFVHLDDLPARMVFRDDAPTGPRMTLRPEAPSLYWAVAFNALWAVLLTIRTVWYTWRAPAGALADDSASSDSAVTSSENPGGDDVSSRSL